MKRMIFTLARIFGYRYLINHASREVHDLANEHVNCHILEIKDREFARRKRAVALLDMVSEYNGCRWCMKEKDTDEK
jgi:hypothetical protein